jgi:hypothetical protein
MRNAAHKLLACSRADTISPLCTRATSAADSPVSAGTEPPPSCLPPEPEPCIDMWVLVGCVHGLGLLQSLVIEEEEEEEFITSGNWRGKHNSLSRVAGADQP